MGTAQLAVVAQLVEHELPKLGVAGSNPVRRSLEANGITDLSESWFSVASVPAKICVRFVFNGSSFRISAPG